MTIRRPRSGFGSEKMMLDEHGISSLQRIQAESQNSLGNAVRFNTAKIGNAPMQENNTKKRSSEKRSLKNSRRGETALRDRGETFEVPMGKQHLRDLRKPHQGAGVIERVERVERNQNIEEESVGAEDTPEMSSDFSKEILTGKAKNDQSPSDFHQSMPAMFVPNYFTNSFQVGFYSNVKEPVTLNSKSQQLQLAGSAQSLDSAGNIRVSSVFVRKRFDLKVFYLLLLVFSAVLSYIRCVSKLQSENKPLLEHS